MAEGVKLEIRIGELSEESVISDRLYNELVELIALRPLALSRVFELGLTVWAATEGLRKDQQVLMIDKSVTEFIDEERKRR
jgi:hypothetical protein